MEKIPHEQLYKLDPGETDNDADLARAMEYMKSTGFIDASGLRCKLEGYAWVGTEILATLFKEKYHA